MWLGDGRTVITVCEMKEEDGGGLALATWRADKEDEKGPPIIGSVLRSHSIVLVWCAFIVGRPSGGEPGWDGDST